MPNPHTVTQGATATPISGTLFDDAGTPVPLLPDTQVEFAMHPARRGQVGVTFRKAAVVLAPAGRWAYHFDPADVAVPGPYKAKVWVLLPGGWQDYPSDEFLDLVVIAAQG